MMTVAVELTWVDSAAFSCDDRKSTNNNSKIDHKKMNVFLVNCLGE